MENQVVCVYKENKMAGLNQKERRMFFAGRMQLENRLWFFSKKLYHYRNTYTGRKRWPLRAHLADCFGWFPLNRIKKLILSVEFEIFIVLIFVSLLWFGICYEISTRGF